MISPMRETSCCSITLDPISKTLKTIAEDNRLRILCLLKSKEHCVCELQEALGLPHNLLVHHLGKLKNVGLIESRKQHKYTYYRLSQDHYQQFLKDINFLLEVKTHEQ